MTDGCFAGSLDLGLGPCRGPRTYRVSLPDLPAEATDGKPFAIDSCEDPSHLGHAVAGAAGNGFGAPVVVIRLVPVDD